MTMSSYLQIVEIDKLLNNQEIFYVTRNILTSTFPIFHEDDIKSSFFLKIIQSYYGIQPIFNIHELIIGYLNTNIALSALF